MQVRTDSSEENERMWVSVTEAQTWCSRYGYSRRSCNALFSLWCFAVSFSSLRTRSCSPNLGVNRIKSASMLEKHTSVQFLTTLNTRVETCVANGVARMENVPQAGLKK